MASKTFKNITNAGTTLRVRGIGDAGVELLHHNDRRTFGSVIASSDAPALALAVLEAAGVVESSDAGVAAGYLRSHIAEQERITAEARELAELEAEALELMNVRLGAAGNPKHLTKETVDPIALEAWISVARRAREMRAEK